MSWPKVKLGDCCEIISGATPKTGNPDYWGGDIPWVSPKSLSKLESKYLDNPTEYITQAGFDSCSTRMLPAMSLLLSCRAPVGLTAINREPICTNQGFKSLIPNPELLDINYLFHVMRRMRPMLEAQGRGATFTEVSKAIVERFEIPLPPLDEQKRIATILDKADGINKAAQNAEEKKNQLIRNTYLHLFGDPLDPSIDSVKLSDVATITMGQSPPGTSYNYTGDGIPLLNGPAEFGEVHPIEVQWTNIPKKLCVLDDILICVRGATAGRMNVADKEYCIGRGLASIRPLNNGDISPEFIIETLHFYYDYFHEKGSGSTFININKEMLAGLKIPKTEISRIRMYTKLKKILSIGNGSIVKNSHSLINSLSQEMLT